jgi:hypothetical protein
VGELIITPTNAQLVFIIHYLPTCFDLYRTSSEHQGIPKVIKLYIVNLKLYTNNQIQDNDKVYYMHTGTHVTLNVCIIRETFKYFFYIL